MKAMIGRKLFLRPGYNYYLYTNLKVNYDIYYCSIGCRMARLEVRAIFPSFAPCARSLRSSVLARFRFERREVHLEHSHSGC